MLRCGGRGSGLTLCCSRMLSASKGNVVNGRTVCGGYHEGFNLFFGTWRCRWCSGLLMCVLFAVRFDVVNMTDLSLCKFCIMYNNPILGL